jgi:two-component system, chemotaxis family, response regulator Rcp1
MREEGRLRILLVEDNIGDALLFRRALGIQNALIEIVHVDNGEAAIATLENPPEGSYDLVFLDLNLPTISGIDILKNLKAEVTLRAMPVVILSSSQDQRDINAAYQNFASVYLVKPNDIAGYTKLARFIDECWFGLAQMPGA